jgi:hypothetical protein
MVGLSAHTPAGLTHIPIAIGTISALIPNANTAYPPSSTNYVKIVQSFVYLTQVEGA